MLERGHPLLLFPTPHALSPRAIRERLGELSLHDGDNEPRAPATTLIGIDWLAALTSPALAAPTAHAGERWDASWP